MLMVGTLACWLWGISFFMLCNVGDSAHFFKQTGDLFYSGSANRKQPALFGLIGFLEATTLTCHSRTTTSVINNINNGCNHRGGTVPAPR